MVLMYARYGGDLSCEIMHEPSGEKIFTDAPVDIGGSAAFFSPTDLIGAALLTCILTTVASVAEKYGIDLAGMEGSVKKTMSPELPRRITKLTIDLIIPLAEDDPNREKIERAVHYCPVHYALNPDILKEIAVTWRSLRHAA